ncbi:MAG: hypothetical protein KJ906_02915 [Nanoarchaeota archaeon]|nr:hypothetical protein [Nanoarchaeota archaeon]
MERSKKIVFVSHCLLNQNARAFGSEKYPGAVKDLTDMLTESGVGIIQLPCPQINYNGGLNRKLKTKDSYDNASYRKHCKNLSTDILNQVQNYLQNKYQVLGIIGVEMSSTCGVHQVENGSKRGPGKGILIEEIEEMMHKKNFQVPIIGMNLNNLYSSMEKIQTLLNYS